ACIETIAGSPGLRGGNPGGTRASPSSAGLGFYMLHANARMQIDVMFAALGVLAVVALSLYFAVDRAMIKIVYWQKENSLSTKTQRNKGGI
ncbi:hypothetical protein ACFL03_13060, partial [Thermodesulfobacteriota bacterium]